MTFLPFQSLYPRFNEVERAYTGFTSSVRLSIHLSIHPSVRPPVCLSVCGQNRVRSVTSTILVGSISYSHILSSNFRRCVACNVCFKIWKFEMFTQILWICNLDFVFFWLGIQYDSIVWVIMRRLGYPQNEGILVVLVLSHIYWIVLCQLYWNKWR